MREKFNPKSQKSKGRIQSDKIDRDGIRNTLEKCIDPFKEDIKGLVNIYSAFIAKDGVNVNNAAENGQIQSNKFVNSLPEDFNTKISSQITTMKSVRKSVRSGDTQIFSNLLTCHVSIKHW